MLYSVRSESVTLYTYHAKMPSLQSLLQG